MVQDLAGFAGRARGPFSAQRPTQPQTGFGNMVANATAAVESQSPFAKPTPRMTPPQPQVAGGGMLAAAQNSAVTMRDNIAAQSPVAPQALAAANANASFNRPRTDFASPVADPAQDPIRARQATDNAQFARGRF